MELVRVFINNFISFDWIILVMAAANIVIYVFVWRSTTKINAHFVKSDQLGDLDDNVKKRIKANTAIDKTLATTELMNYRKKMNALYALYSNLTSMFPLMGMLGTVLSLLPMVSTLGNNTTGSFFSALTSTFWGIVAALVFKFLDSFISYKIEDNEKYMEFLLKASVNDEVGVL